MSIADGLWLEFDEEMAATRRYLERVPDDRLGWKPHEKSMTLGRLATFLAELPGWIVNTLTRDELDIFPPGSPPPKWEALGSRKAILDLFERNVAAARTALQGARDPDWARPWAFKMQGKAVWTAPRSHVYRSTVMNHLVHHRAQLGVFFRLLDVPVPAVYGPSADERM
jgi:uncharacterized damage-inducible protein DinB